MFKKFICISMVLVLALTYSVAFAASSFTVNGGSLSDLSYEELLELKDAVEDAISEKRGESGAFQVSSGKYIVGEDIPAGTYSCECKGAYSSAILQVYESESSSWPVINEVMAELYGSSVIGKLELKDGNVLQIQGGTVDFMQYDGI